jgi:hypothetical protein
MKVCMLHAWEESKTMDPSSFSYTLVYILISVVHESYHVITLPLYGSNLVCISRSHPDFPQHWMMFGLQCKLSHGAKKKHSFHLLFIFQSWGHAFSSNALGSFFSSFSKLFNTLFLWPCCYLVISGTSQQIICLCLILLGKVRFYNL